MLVLRNVKINRKIGNKLGTSDIFVMFPLKAGIALMQRVILLFVSSELASRVIFSA